MGLCTTAATGDSAGDDFLGEIGHGLAQRKTKVSAFAPRLLSNGDGGLQAREIHC